jgi:tetratricopeptide (TPR) repeat protein
LIFQAILIEPAVDRCRRLLDPFRHDRLNLAVTARPQDAHFDATERAVISRLDESPHSFEALRLLNLTSLDRLVALVYTLRATRQVAASGFRDSRVPRTASSQGLRSVSPDERLSLPSSGAPGRDRHKESQAKRLWDERTMEARALEAWASAEGDDRQLKKALVIVDRAAKSFPRNAQIRYYRGCLHKQANDVEQAMTEFRRVLDLDPENLEAMRELEVLNRRANAAAKKSVFGLLRRKR